MAKQTSIITLDGKIDGLSFFKRGGKYFARKSSGPSKSKIMSSPSYERTRQNLTEFSGVAQAAAAFNKCFNPVKFYRDGTFFRRVSKSLRAILRKAQEQVGQRSVRIAQQRLMLSNLGLNSTELSSVFLANITHQHTAERNSAGVVTDPFKPALAVAAPATATHFQIVQFLTVVSDTIFQPETGEYKLANEALNGKSQAAHSDYYDVNSQEDLTITLNTDLPGAPVLGDDVTVVQCVGITFFDYAGGAYHQVHASKAMKVVDAF